MGNLNTLGAQAFFQCVDVWRLDPTSPYCYDYPFSKRASLCIFVQRNKIKVFETLQEIKGMKESLLRIFYCRQNTRKPLSCWNSLRVNLDGKVICWALIHLLPCLPTTKICHARIFCVQANEPACSKALALCNAMLFGL